DINVAVQAETTLGVLGGRAAVEALSARLASAVFALRRQAMIALAQADSAAGVAAAAALAGDPDWRWRSVAAEAFAAAKDRARLGAIARASAEGRLAVAGRFVGVVPRPDDYLVRRLAGAQLPDAAERWGPAAPIATGRGPQDYRDVVRRYLLAALGGQPPRVTIDTDRGTMVVELSATEAPLTVAAFLSLVDRRYFDGSRWHRVVPNFVVQDGDPRGD